MFIILYQFVYYYHFDQCLRGFLINSMHPPWSIFDINAVMSHMSHVIILQHLGIIYFLSEILGQYGYFIIFSQLNWND